MDRFNWSMSHQLEHRAIRPILRGAIRMDAKGIPASILVLNLAFHDLDRLDHFGQQFFHVRHIDSGL